MPPNQSVQVEASAILGETTMNAYSPTNMPDGLLLWLFRSLPVVGANVLSVSVIQAMSQLPIVYQRETQTDLRECIGDPEPWRDRKIVLTTRGGWRLQIVSILD